MWSESQFDRIFKRVASRAGLQKNVYGYLLRHTRLTDIRRSIDEQHALAFGGHAKDSKMGAIYNHLNSQDLEMQVVSKLYEEEAIPEGTKRKLEIELETQKRTLTEQQKVIQDLNTRLEKWEERENTPLLSALADSELLEKEALAHPSLKVKMVQRGGRIVWKLLSD